MNPHPLDNPVWQSLVSQHASLAVMREHAGRYPADVAPFVAVDKGDPVAGDQLCEIVSVGESAYLVGVAPPLDSRWQILQQASVAQMICTTHLEPKPAPQMRVLTAADRDDMLALTALVFPGFFRARTIDMGRYLGIYAGEQLAAMAGERFRTDDYQEISAVCTHPDFVSRGFAARLIAELCNA